MPTAVWSIRLAGSATFLPFQGPVVEFRSGPDEVRMDWGVDDAVSGDPRLVTYAPDASGNFANVHHYYPAGQFEITATGVFGAAEQTARIAVTTFPEDVGGLAFGGAVFADFFAGGTGADTFSGLGGDDFVLGSDGGDRLNGGAGNDYLRGDAGNDSMMGGSGDDVLFGGAGNDVLRADAGFGSDALFGDAGDDRLYAGPGGSQLDGGEGRDTLVGGTGMDRFHYVNTPDGSRDAILGFTQGEDKLVLTFLRGIGVPMTADRVVHRPGNMADDGPYVIYLSDTGRLLVDQNGTDAGGRIELAMVVGAPPLAFGDFLF
jgi:Ca2+-binding RTX toxin-like protein